jgi:hypothetical protein
VWAHDSRWGFWDTWEEGPSGVAIDKDGNAFVVGWYATKIDWTGGNLKSAQDADSPDSYVVKFDSTGNHLWTRAIKGAGRQYVTGIAPNPQGEVVLTGYTGTLSPQVDFSEFGVGAVALGAGANYAWVLSLDMSDQPKWPPFVSTGAGYASPRSVAVDGQGNVVVAGYVGPGDDLGCPKLDASPDMGSFVALFSGAEGTCLWEKRLRIGVGEPDVRFDTQGNIVGVGSYNNTFTLLGQEVAKVDGNDAFVFKLSADGNTLKSSRKFTGAYSDTALAVAVDQRDNLFVMGTYEDQINFDGHLSAKNTSGYMGILAEDRSDRAVRGPQGSRERELDAAAQGRVATLRRDRNQQSRSHNGNTL